MIDRTVTTVNNIITTHLKVTKRADLKISQHKKKIFVIMCADAANETYCGDHSVIYTDTESLCCTPEINTMLYGNYTSSKQCPSGRDLDFFSQKQTNKQNCLPETIYWFFFFWQDPVACGILVPRPGIEPVPLHWKLSLNHWIAREIPTYWFWESNSGFPFALPCVDEKCKINGGGGGMHYYKSWAEMIHDWKTTRQAKGKNSILNS